MSDWAQDMLALFWDKVDLNNPDLTPEEKEKLANDGLAAFMTREEMYVISSFFKDKIPYTY